MKNLEKAYPLLIITTMAALRYWVLPHINLPPVKTLFGPLEVAAYAIGIYAYARKPTGLMLLYIALPVAALLWKDQFNFVTVLISMLK